MPGIEVSYLIGNDPQSSERLVVAPVKGNKQDLRHDDVRFGNPIVVAPEQGGAKRIGRISSKVMPQFRAEIPGCRSAFELGQCPAKDSTIEKLSAPRSPPRRGAGRPIRPRSWSSVNRQLAGGPPPACPSCGRPTLLESTLFLKVIRLAAGASCQLLGDEHVAHSHLLGSSNAHCSIPQFSCRKFALVYAQY